MESKPIRICQYCNHEVPIDQKVCPNCYRKEHHPFKMLLAILLTLCVVFIFLCDIASISLSQSPEYRARFEQPNQKIENQYDDSTTFNKVSGKSSFIEQKDKFSDFSNLSEERSSDLGLELPNLERDRTV